MLSVFPELLSFGLLAPFFLRMAVGVFFLKLGVRHARAARRTASPETEDAAALQRAPFRTFLLWLLVIVEVVIGILLTIGLTTQPAALVGMFLALLLFRLRRQSRALAPYSTTLFIFVFIICFSLLFLGAGRPAFDLPL